MFKKTHFLVGLTVAVGSLLCLTLAEAKKPGKPPGGGGGNPGRTSYTIVKLDDANGTWVECYAHDINNFGDVVGQVEDPDTSEQRAVYWEVSRSDGAIESQISPLTGGSRADGINDAGEIVGYGIDSYGQAVAIFWANAAAAPLLLPRLNENMLSSASAISNDGVITGFSDSQAVAWSVQSLPDGALSVDPLPSIIEASDAKALGVNDGGTICGEAGWPYEAMVWTEVASQTLHRAKKVAVASASDINSNGTIVGWGGTGIVDHEAVVWLSADGKMILISKYLGRRSPFVFLKEARAVNEMGEIVGHGWDGSSRRAFLAIPE